jgi:FMN phosphatase YigB (HAD superfamily)
MFNAILFDLDDTLLRNEMTTFVNAYWGTLLPKITKVFPDHHIKDAILTGTQAMISAQRSKASLREIFIQSFQATTKLDFTDVEPIFMNYYQNEYREIERLTQKVSGAISALNKAAAITEHIVLATIPIFPLIAIEERVRWAGLDDFPFSFITSFETMHASKPNPDYYAEIADHIGCPPESCLMIGNDCKDDMVAKAVGMKTFLVTDYAMHKGDGKFEPEFQGTFGDLVEFLASLDE